jgi:hypothetical protein
MSTEKSCSLMAFASKFRPGRYRFETDKFCQAVNHFIYMRQLVWKRTASGRGLVLASIPLLMAGIA